MKCPKCNQTTTFESTYKLNLCKNKHCDIYMKDDVSKFTGQKVHKRQTDDLIDDILENFNFEKVNIAMKFLDWRWASIGRVPTINELKESAREQLQNCIKEAKDNKTEFYISSGGLKSFYSFDENFLELEFVLTDWTEEDDIT